ncbi:MAG: hypothetical protein E7604_12295 [Ruminococcaceae bacterium]|nr:hypothetical protein [Oscillospiraceae bacterium]
MSTFLLALLAVAGLAACGDNADVKTDVTTDIGTETQAPQETEEVRFPGPEKTDLNGFNLRIATTPFNDYNRMIYSEETTGEPINDALFESVSDIISTYNCSVELILHNDFPDVTKAVATSVKAGSDDYDISFNHDNQTVANALANCFLNVRDCSVYNFDAPWWTNTAEVFTVGDQLLFVSNYLTYSPLYCACAIVYNKELATEYQLEIPYDDIAAGNWYMDDFTALLQNTNTDLNGDGVMKLGEDRYGFITGIGGLIPLQVSLGADLLGKDEDGYLKLTLDTDGLVKMMESFDRMMENGVNSTVVDGVWGYGTNYFRNNQAIFHYLPIRRIASELRDIDFRLGALPVPKLDENQKEYISGAYDTYWAVLQTAYDRHDSIAVILEAMAQHCYYEVLPVVYETVLQVKLSDSQEDAQTYEIIRNTLLVDVAYAFNEQNYDGLYKLVRMMAEIKTGNVASTIAKMEASAEKAIKKINDTYREMSELNDIG